MDNPSNSRGRYYQQLEKSFETLFRATFDEFVRQGDGFAKMHAMIYDPVFPSRQKEIAITLNMTPVDTDAMLKERTRHDSEDT